MHCGFISCRGKTNKQTNTSALGEGQETVWATGSYASTARGQLPLGEAGNPYKCSQRHEAVWLPQEQGWGRDGQEHWESSSIQGNREPSPYHEPGSSSVPLEEGQECRGHVERHLLPVRSLGTCQLVPQWDPATHLLEGLGKKNCCSVPQLCLTLCDPMDCSTPGFPVLHHLPELAQTHVHRVSDAIQPPHPLLSPSPPAFSFSQHEGQLFPSGGRSIGASASASILPMNIQNWFPLGLIGLISCCPRDSRVFSSTTVLWHQVFTAQPF